MNLARIEYYFADFLSVLEETDKSKWTVPLVSGYSELDEDQKPKYLDYSNEAANICITSNVWFVGTANNDDSTSLITDKVYDRAQVLDMDERESEFKSRKPAQISMDIDELIGLFDTAKSDDSNRMNEADREKIRQVDEYLKEMDITFGNRIVSQMEDFIPVYIACGGEKNEAIDYFLTHKILRKLDERYEPYLVEKLEDLRQCLNDTYGEGVFKQSLEKIKKLTEKIQG
jgi:5-methylcytosine-specific restriction endonuclease McrBC GTP-binding regulatory subunit McrB